MMFADDEDIQYEALMRRKPKYRGFFDITPTPMFATKRPPAKKPHPRDDQRKPHARRDEGGGK